MIMQFIQRARVVAKSVTNQELDAADLIERDHMQFEVLFLRLRMAKKRNQRQALFGRIREAFDLHAQLEEQIFYPACEEFPEIKPLITEARQEHAEVHELLADLSGTFKKGGKVNTKLHKLTSTIERHINEEENEILPMARIQLTEEALISLARRMVEFKRVGAPKKKAA
jgi:hemerythrin superfamily protein